MPPIVILIFLLIWLAFGLVAGCITGAAMNCLLPKSKSRVFIDSLIGVAGCLIGVFISGWAAQRTFNGGVPRQYFIWDENGRAVDWRTALAEHQGMLAMLCSIGFVILWHFAISMYKRREVGNLK